MAEDQAMMFGWNITTIDGRTQQHLYKVPAPLTASSLGGVLKVMDDVTKMVFDAFRVKSVPLLLMQNPTVIYNTRHIVYITPVSYGSKEIEEAMTKAQRKIGFV